MSINRFEDVQVWQLSRELAKDIYDITSCDSLIKDYSFKNQITRASLSIMSNIAEGFERKSNKEFVQFLFIAKGSAGELRSQLYVASDLNYITKEKFEELLDKTELISKSLSGFIKYLKESNK